MDIKEFKLAITEFTDKAERIACALHGYSKENITYTTFDEDEAEVNFSKPSGCGCCSGDDYTVCIPLEDLEQDIDKLVKEKEQQIAEKKRIKEKKEAERKQAEAKALEINERRTLEKLKAKYGG